MKPKTLQDAIRYFSDEQTCIDTVAAMRWPDGKPACPACEGKEHYYLATQKRWKCKACGRQFSVKLGTIFEDSPVSLDKWLVAFWMLANCRNGVSSYELSRTIGVTQKSAWFMLHRVRLAMKNTRDYVTKIGNDNGGEVEIDETFIGPKPKNMHRTRRMRYNATGQAKTAIAGMLDRDRGMVRARVVPNVKRETLQNIVLKNIMFGSRVYSDDAVAYDNLTWRYIHEVVNHSERYVQGRVHTNGIENFWSLLKRSLSGTYIAVETFHLDRYLDEQVFRFNTRQTKKRRITDADRFLYALSQVSGKRLTLAEVTGKIGG